MRIALARRRLVCAWTLAAVFSATAQEGRDDGLARLAAVLDKQLSRRKGALPLPWHESILNPDTSRLAWYPRSLTTRSADGESFRAAFDPVTRWYFIARVPKGGARLQYFGPLEENAKGTFVEAFAVPAR